MFKLHLYFSLYCKRKIFR